MSFSLDAHIRGRAGVVVLTLALLSLSVPALQASEAGSRLLLEARPVPEDGSQELPRPGLQAGESRAEARESTGNPQEEIAGQRERLERLSRRYGEYDAELLEPLRALARVQQDAGRHEDALETLDRAAYISRMHNGLEYAGDIPLLSAMVESHMALGERQEVADRQAQLMQLTFRTEGLDQVDRAQLMEQMGDWSMEAFWSGLHSDREPEIRVGFNASGRSGSDDPRQAAFRHLYQARMYYLQSIRMRIAAQGQEQPQLPGLEYKHIQALYLGAYREGLLEEPDFFLAYRERRTGSRISPPPVDSHSSVYYNGRAAWQRMIDYQVARDDVSLHALTEALLAMADWDLLFSHNGQAVEGYEEVYDFLLKQGFTESGLEQIFNPAVPQRLPAFLPLPFSRESHGLAPETPVEYAGYVDVQYRLSRYGKAGRVRITGGAGEVPQRVESRIRRLLRAYPARPRLRNGEVTPEEVRERYHFAWIQNQDNRPATIR